MTNGLVHSASLTHFRVTMRSGKVVSILAKDKYDAIARARTDNDFALTATRV